MSPKNADQPATLEALTKAVEDASRAYDEAHANDASQEDQERLYQALSDAQEALDAGLPPTPQADPDTGEVLEGVAVEVTPQDVPDPDGRDQGEEPPHPAEVRHLPAVRPAPAEPRVQVSPTPTSLPAVRPPTTVAVGPVRDPGLARPTGMVAMEDILASMTEEDFDARLRSLKVGQDRLQRIQRDLMTEDVDYGRVGNIAKPTLLKPGAEKLCRFYGLVADFTNTLTIGDGLTAPALAYTSRCDLHFQDISGPIVGVGYGTANSWEARYRWRSAGKVCPACGNKVRRSSRQEGQWWCPRDPGCGSNFDAGTPEARAIEAQPAGKVENPDPHDLAVTLLKMAEKRAHVDGTLRATATSGLFTQDVEDQGPAAVQEAPRAAQEPQDGSQPPHPAQDTTEARQERQAAGQDRNDPRAVPPRQAAPQAGPGQWVAGPLDDRCPKHKKPWRSNSRGWFCPSKDNQTDNGWCVITAHPQWVANQP